MRHIIILTMVTFLMVMVTSVFAQEFVIYPNKGQSNEQMEKDKLECYSWAEGDSGFDPMAPPTTTEPPPQTEAAKGGTVRGTTRGALAGAAVGAIAGDSKSDTRTATKVGAASGAVVGTARRNDQKRQEAQKQQAWEQQQVNQYKQGRTNYNRAYSACMEGRDYAVK